MYLQYRELLNVLIYIYTYYTHNTQYLRSTCNFNRIIDQNVIFKVVVDNKNLNGTSLW